LRRILVADDDERFDPLRVRNAMSSINQDDPTREDGIEISQAADNLRAVSEVVSSGSGDIPRDVYDAVNDGFEGDLKADKLAWNRYLVWRRSRMLEWIDWCDNRIQEAARQNRLTPQDVLRYRAELTKDMYEAADRVTEASEKPVPTLADPKADVTVDISETKEQRQSRDTLRAVVDIFRRELREQKMIQSKIPELKVRDEDEPT
jgi:hypothetical protein